MNEWSSERSVQERDTVLQVPSEPLDTETAHPGEDGAVDALTAHFRRTSRGRIVDLPRWAQ